MNIWSIPVLVRINKTLKVTTASTAAAECISFKVQFLPSVSTPQFLFWEQQGRRPCVLWHWPLKQRTQTSAPCTLKHISTDRLQAPEVLSFYIIQSFALPVSVQVDRTFPLVDKVHYTSYNMYATFTGICCTKWSCCIYQSHIVFDELSCKLLVHKLDYDY